MAGRRKILGWRGWKAGEVSQGEEREGQLEASSRLEGLCHGGESDRGECHGC